MSHIPRKEKHQFMLLCASFHPARDKVTAPSFISLPLGFNIHNAAAPTVVVGFQGRRPG